MTESTIAYAAESRPVALEMDPYLRCAPWIEIIKISEQPKKSADQDSSEATECELPRKQY